MGDPFYSSISRSARADALGYTDMSKSVHEVFTQRDLHPKMSPRNVLREARDSNNHPLSVPIIIALDVTGSMGDIPRLMIATGLPTIMDNIFKAGISDPQILFMAIGDHECDTVPLQVGQFESSDQEMDEWLSDIFVEGRGGGNDGESYLLAWLFAGYHTVHDSMEKRNNKGFLFTIGDEKTLPSISTYDISKITGTNQYSDLSAGALLQKASELYNVYHIHVKQTRQGSTKSTQEFWKELMGDHVIMVEDYKTIPDVIAHIVATTNDIPYSIDTFDSLEDSKKENKPKESTEEFL